MQLSIDTVLESAVGLRFAAKILLDCAALKEPTPESERVVIPPPPTAETIAPPAPTAPIIPPAPVDSVSTAPAALEYDSSGVPWDARIHQQNKNQKRDNTWKLKKGIDKQLVENVMRELAPLIRTAGTAAAPVTGLAASSDDLDPSYVFGRAPLPVEASAPVPLPPPPPAPHIPQAPQGITTPGAEGPEADPFRNLVSKITKARGANRITPEEVTQCVAAAGAPTLQLLNNMPHLIPIVESSIDAILAMR